ncbi:MAG: hypothetical protein CSA29_05475 [Desulfobacterales bacterium]|nr:MAG: hypothetical protein CSA29_05475 [Desulfobacterales bacterium]
MKYNREDIKVRIVLVNDKVITGRLNMNGFNRLSDFLDQDDNANLKVYDAVYAGNPKIDFIIIPKSKVVCYSPES